MINTKACAQLIISAVVLTSLTACGGEDGDGKYFRGSNDSRVDQITVDGAEVMNNSFDVCEADEAAEDTAAKGQLDANRSTLVWGSDVLRYDASVTFGETYMTLDGDEFYKEGTDEADELIEEAKTNC